jgi:hypothetical protein
LVLRLGSSVQRLEFKKYQAMNKKTELSFAVPWVLSHPVLLLLITGSPLITCTDDLLCSVKRFTLKPRASPRGVTILGRYG